MIKYASNAFLATKISFINEIANVCEETGADVTVVAEGMGLDRRIGPSFLRAGIGYGGSCFPKDIAALKQLAGNSGYHFQLLTSVIEVNELQKRRVVGKLTKHLGSLRGKTIALLGLAFKPDTNDMREAASLVLAVAAARRGGAGAGLGPGRDRGGAAAAPGRGALRRACSTRCEGADAAVIVTEWDEVARVSVRRGRTGDEDGGARRRAERSRPGGGTRGLVRLRVDRPPEPRLTTPMEAIILAGGKGGAARAMPPAGGRRRWSGRRATARLVPRRTASPGQGSTRVIVSCASRHGRGLRRGARGARGRGRPGRRARAARPGRRARVSPPAARQEAGPVFAVNGDELVDVDFAALAEAHALAGGRGDDHRRAASLCLRGRRARR